MTSPNLLPLLVVRSFMAAILAACLPLVWDGTLPRRHPEKDATVLILGGGVAGITAAKTLVEQGIKGFKIIEAREELGGRLRSERFGEPGREIIVEIGASWIQGIGGGEGQGPENPIWTLVQKYGAETRESSYYNNISMFNESGPANFTDTFDKFKKACADLTVAAGACVDLNLVDTSARTGYGIIGIKLRTPHEMAVEYYTLDWEYGQTPEQPSWIASSWGNNYTFDVESGGFSRHNRLSVDQRGLKTHIQEEAKAFLDPDQVLLNSVVTTVSYSEEGVTITLADGTRLGADFALVSFSLGVLQHDDVVWEPVFPG